VFLKEFLALSTIALGERTTSVAHEMDNKKKITGAKLAGRSVTQRIANNATLKLNPPSEPYEVHTSEDSEVVFGLVGPLGTDNDKITGMIADRLRTYGYISEVIKISQVIIPALAGPEAIRDDSKYEKAKSLIDRGNQIRKESKNNAVLAIAAAAEIARRRPNPEGEVQRVAYIISSLKHPEEVAELRKIYAGGFYLFAVHTDRERRVHCLAGHGAKAMKRSQAWELIDRDEHEPEEYGQHTRDTFHLADFFLADENNDDKLRHAICRCLDLTFGNPIITPTFNEFAMFMAFASSLRSADLSRQIGAVVARKNEILSTGANDCPCYGGGLYWPAFIGDRVDDVPRGRDYKRGCDSNAMEKSKLLAEIVEKFPEAHQLLAEGILKGSRINEITEYGRVVHAEMEAMLACARGTVTCIGATLYCTTFPCHNCAKHIIAAGIEQVVYIEPYPKSKAIDFHDDSATTDRLEGEEKKVRFKPFIGVGPRQFFDLFSLSLSSGRPVRRKTTDGRVDAWSAAGAIPRVPMLPVAHRQFEKLAGDYLNNLTSDQETQK
jgi:deoxycytidylate deaminase